MPFLRPTTPEPLAAAATEGMGAIHYLPIATTLLAAYFAARLWLSARSRPRPQTWWWFLGVTCYGMGTALESIITVSGNSPRVNSLWYGFGAILGAYPLAQGTLWLLARRRTARIVTAISLPIVGGLFAAAVLSPSRLAELEAHRPSGAALGWQWLRGWTPLVNGYAVLVLVGGAVWSSARLWRRTSTRSQAIGTGWIAAGGLLPGIGGALAKNGWVEALYLAEWFGLLLIWLGHRTCARTLAEPSS